MDYFLIYLWTRLDVLNGFYLVIASLSLVAIAIIAFSVIDFDNSEQGDAEIWAIIKKPVKVLLTILITCILLFILTPTKKDTLFIYFIPKITHSEFAIDSMDIINKLPKVLQKQINNYLNEESE